MAVIATASGSRPSAQASTLGSGAGRISSEITLVSSKITEKSPFVTLSSSGLQVCFAVELGWGW